MFALVILIFLKIGWFVLPFRPTNDDVDVLKRELISVQQRMNDMSLEKEKQIEPLRQALIEMSVYKLNTKHPADIPVLVMSTPNDSINSKVHSIKSVRPLFSSFNEPLFPLDDIRLR